MQKQLLQLSIPMEPGEQKSKLPPDVEREVVEEMGMILLQILEAEEETQEGPDDS